MTCRTTGIACPRLPVRQRLPTTDLKYATTNVTILAVRTSWPCRRDRAVYPDWPLVALMYQRSYLAKFLQAVVIARPISVLSLPLSVNLQVEVVDIELPEDVWAEIAELTVTFV